MTMFHAVLWIDHQQAQILQFDAEHVQASKVKAHSHHTHQHHSAVRTEHEFYGEVCDALAGIAEVLVTGSRNNLAEFDRYARKHRAALVPALVGSEVVDHPTEAQLVALARKWFLKHDRMSGVPTPT
jgi:hypothetical protein